MTYKVDYFQIGDLASAPPSSLLFFFSMGEYDTYGIYFLPASDRTDLNQKLEKLSKEITPLGVIRMQGSVKKVEPVEVVTKLQLKD